MDLIATYREANAAFAKRYAINNKSLLTVDEYGNVVKTETNSSVCVYGTFHHFARVVDGYWQWIWKTAISVSPPRPSDFDDHCYLVPEMTDNTFATIDEEQVELVAALSAQILGYEFVNFTQVGSVRNVTGWRDMHKCDASELPKHFRPHLIAALSH